MRIISLAMNRRFNNIRLLFLVLMLGINSFQLAVAAGSTLLELADEKCHASHQHDVMVIDHESLSDDCCGQSDMPAGDCSSQSCADSGHVSGVLAITVASRLKTFPPVSETIESNPSFFNSRYSAAELRPPRV